METIPAVMEQLPPPEMVAEADPCSINEALLFKVALAVPDRVRAALEVPVIPAVPLMVILPVTLIFKFPVTLSWAFPVTWVV